MSQVQALPREQYLQLGLLGRRRSRRNRGFWDEIARDVDYFVGEQRIERVDIRTRWLILCEQIGPF